MKKVVPVSVVIPCYRCAGSIKRAIESVFSQTVDAHEIIIVDDCSGDATSAILRELLSIYPDKLRIVEMDLNKGAASARNAGWNLSLQAFIAFLDADDSWHPDKLRIQYEFMSNNPGITLSGTECKMFDDAALSDDLEKKLAVKKVSGLSMMFSSPFSTPTVMLKRDISFRFHDGQRYAEDIFLWQKIGLSGLQVYKIKSALSYVHKPFYGSGGLSRNLLEMEKCELKNFLVLYNQQFVKLQIVLLAIIYSAIKFIKRVLVVSFRR
jgi:glycosyltransferase involved in cell wall biosynthesis